MSLIRFTTRPFVSNPVSSLARLATSTRNFSHLFDLPDSEGEMSTFGDWSPALDVFQDAETVLVKVELPGMKREDITLSLHDGLLTVAGERSQKNGDTATTVLRNERFFGRFERTITMPVQVDGTRVSATYEDGILTITLPKAESAKPRRIEIGIN